MTDRFIRRKDAGKYLAMDRNRFDNEVRPYLVEIPIGKQGIAFDRVDLDAWADQYKQRYGRQPQKKIEEDVCKNAKVDLDSVGEMESGTLKHGASTPSPGGSGEARAHLMKLRRKKSRTD
ncbi:MAG: hypothetical protein ABW201_19920 [Candidatus Thiodiazotropha sp.]